jgi:hypothetical protein
MFYTDDFRFGTFFVLLHAKLFRYLQNFLKLLLFTNSGSFLVLASPKVSDSGLIYCTALAVLVRDLQTQPLNFSLSLFPTTQSVLQLLCYNQLLH